MSLSFRLDQTPVSTSTRRIYGMLKRPKDLTDKYAKEYFDELAGILEAEGVLTAKTFTSFLILCRTYHDYRVAEDIREKKIALDFYQKYAKPFGLIPHASTTKTTVIAAVAAEPEKKLEALFPKVTSEERESRR